MAVPSGEFTVECEGARRLDGVVRDAKAEASPPHSKVRGPSELGPYRRKRGHLKVAATWERKNRTPGKRGCGLEMELDRNF